MEIDEETKEVEGNNVSVISASVRCSLDAEEDTRRHDKLKGFYESFGCTVKPNAKVQYLNNNDFESYRKIPMHIALKAPTEDGRHAQRGKNYLQGSLVGRQGNDSRKLFLPVRLLEAAGERVNVFSRDANAGRRVDWLIVEDGQGSVQFRTTVGQYLMANVDGTCCADHTSIEHPSTKLRLFRVPDEVSSTRFSEPDCDEDNNSRRMELWMIQSVHRSFLSVDSANSTMVCTKEPGFWQSNSGDLSLTYTKDTTPRRLHYLKAWQRQTVDYVLKQRERYLQFNLKTMSVREALNFVKRTPYFPFRVGRPGEPAPSVRSLCFRVAEAARDAGQPDWVQLVALVHALGNVVPIVDMKTKIEAENDFDWTIITRSRVVGCGAPTCSPFSEFRSLNKDERSNEYSSPQGMYDLHCGLENVLMTWTGPEYMHFLLRHNQVAIPEEGLAMLRYFTLGDWHTYNEYEHLENADDRGVKAFVGEFDQLRRAASRDGELEELSDGECDRLWRQHYGYICEKFGLDGELRW